MEALNSVSAIFDQDQAAKSTSTGLEIVSGSEAIKLNLPLQKTKTKEHCESQIFSGEHLNQFNSVTHIPVINPQPIFFFFNFIVIMIYCKALCSSFLQEVVAQILKQLLLLIVKILQRYKSITLLRELFPS